MRGRVWAERQSTPGPEAFVTTLAPNDMVTRLVSFEGRGDVVQLMLLCLCFLGGSNLFILMNVLVIEPRISSMLSMRPTTEQHPPPPMYVFTGSL